MHARARHLALAILTVALATAAPSAQAPAKVTSPEQFFGFKMGAEGSSIASKNGEIRIPAFDVPVVDSTGCGDAYCAGFIVGLSMGWDLERAGRLGTAASAQVITGLGSDAGIVDLDQTIAFMETATIRASP